MKKRRKEWDSIRFWYCPQSLPRFIMLLDLLHWSVHHKRFLFVKRFLFYFCLCCSLLSTFFSSYFMLFMLVFYLLVFTRRIRVVNSLSASGKTMTTNVLDKYNKNEVQVRIVSIHDFCIHLRPREWRESERENEVKKTAIVGVIRFFKRFRWSEIEKGFRSSFHGWKQSSEILSTRSFVCLAEGKQEVNTVYRAIAGIDRHGERKRVLEKLQQSECVWILLPGCLMPGTQTVTRDRELGKREILFPLRVRESWDSG